MFTFVLQMSNVQVSVATDEGFHDESTHDTEPLVRDYLDLYVHAHIPFRWARK